ncbi:MAG TPA: hypothetical protein VEK11_19160 [Thermoanaerobaculia bacterium]|nr:hypothetical protein [Thermoanaerobaculia bacterium]
MDRELNKSLIIGIALAGIALELTAIVLLASKRITMPVATPLIITGMFLAFVPVFVVARRARRK